MLPASTCGPQVELVCTEQLSPCGAFEARCSAWCGTCHGKAATNCLSGTASAYCAHATCETATAADGALGADYPTGTLVNTCQCVCAGSEVQALRVAATAHAIAHANSHTGIHSHADAHALESCAAVSTACTFPPGNATSPPPPRGESSLDAGAIAGAVVGGVVGAALLSYFVWRCFLQGASAPPPAADPASEPLQTDKPAVYGTI